MTPITAATVALIGLYKANPVNASVADSAAMATVGRTVDVFPIGKSVHLELIEPYIEGRNDLYTQNEYAKRASKLRV